MKPFQAEVYNKKRRLYELVLVRWLYNSVSEKVTIKEVIGRDGKLWNEIEPSHLQAIYREAEKLSRHLTHVEKIEMGNEISNSYEPTETV